MLFAETTALHKIAKLNKRIRAIQGGTAASKTISTLLYLIDLCQTDESPTITSIVAESLPHLKKGAMRDFLLIMQNHRYYKDDNWNRTDCIYTFETGSKIEFFGVDSQDKVRGPRRDRLFMNEANNIPFETFEQLEVRTREFCILDWNPTNEFWFYTDVLGKRNDVDHIILTYIDNEALDEETKKSIEQRKDRKSWWQVYGLGQLGEVEGKIYTNWNIIDQIPHEARLERRGLDFGYTNDPTVLEAIYSYNGGFIIDEEIYQKGLSNKSIADMISNLPQPQTPIIADSAEPKSIDELKSYGINVLGAQKGPGSVYQGIQYVQAQKISLTARSVKTIKAYRNYLYLVDKNGKITNTPDDTVHEWSNPMDAIRYGLDSYRPRVQNRKPLIMPKFTHR